MLPTVGSHICGDDCAEGPSAAEGGAAAASALQRLAVVTYAALALGASGCVCGALALGLALGRGRRGAYRAPVHAHAEVAMGALAESGPATTTSTCTNGATGATAKPSEAV